MSEEKGAVSIALSTVLVGLFAALVAALALVPKLDIAGGVPITAQSLGVMLAGALLGPLRGFLALLVFYVLLIAGLPLLSGGRGGIGVLSGVTGGYILGWLAGAFVIGFLVKYFAARCERPLMFYLATFFSCVVGGIGVIYLFGIPWQAAVSGASVDKVIVGSAAFIPGDLIKALIASAVAVAVHRSYRSLLGVKH